MDVWIINTLNGLSFGLLLFLLAVGLSLTLGLMGVLNLTHGCFYAVGGYIGYSVSRSSGNFLLGVLAGAALVALVGLVMERLLIRPFYGQHLQQVLLTFGLIYILADISKWVWGGFPLTVDKPWLLEGSIPIAGQLFPSYRLALIVFGLVVALGIWLLVEKTKVGAIIRAGVDDQQMVLGAGINIKLVFMGVFTLGASLAGIGGVLGSPVVGLYPGVDMQILMLALVVVVIGGMGSVLGALLGGVLIGMADSFSKVLIPQLALFTIFGLLAAALVFRPSGILGKRER